MINVAHATVFSAQIFIFIYDLAISVIRYQTQTLCVLSDVNLITIDHMYWPFSGNSDDEPLRIQYVKMSEMIHCTQQLLKHS